MKVRTLYTDLKVRGYDPWLDEVDLVPGQIWKVEIPNAIRQAGIFLACLSSQSVGKIGYVQNEFRLALSAFGERPPGSIFLIPVRLDDCDVPDLHIPDRGLSLRDIQWVDLWQGEGFDRLVRAIDKAREVSNQAPRLHRPAAEAMTLRSGGVQNIASYSTDVADREPPRRAASLWRNTTIVAAIAGAIGTVGAALSPWLIEKVSNGSGRTQKIPRAEHVEVTSPEAPPNPVAEKLFDCDDCPLMVALAAGSFIMGSTEAERYGAEQPQRRVQIAQPFALGLYEVTFDEWDACVKGGGCNGYEPKDGGWGQGRRPVIEVSWKDAQAYVAWLSEKTGQPYRLPSEAEWEYAARAGTVTRYWWGDEPPTPEQANFGENVGQTTAVGAYRANPWGIYDVHGNVREWVEDCWNDSYQGAPSDGSAWTSGDCSSRIVRGGAWTTNPGNLRSAYRLKYNAVERSNRVGFRVARTLSPSEI